MGIFNNNEVLPVPLTEHDQAPTTLKVDFAKLPLSPFCHTLLEILSPPPHKTCIVGGAVRDMLQNKTPQDIDMATSLTPNQVIEILQTHHIKTIPTGLSHGTVTALAPKPFTETVEITTLRHDISTTGRHATVTFSTSFKEDAARRDFTFNALYLDRQGFIFDFFTGLEDLRQGLVTFIGDPNKRIQEDHLRILRYIRFFTRYDIRDNPPTDIEHALRTHAHLLKNLSRERIGQEIYNILHSTSPYKGIYVMQDLDLFNIILPDLHITPSLLEAFKTWDNDLTNHLPSWQTIPHIPLSRAILRLAFLCQKTPDMSSFRQHLRFSNNTLTLIKKLKDITIINKNEPQSFYNLIYQHTLTETIAILQMQYPSPHDVPDIYLQTLHTFKNKMPLKTHTPLSGHDFIAHGIPQGNILGKTLKHAHTLWINSGFTKTKEACITQTLNDIKHAP